MGFVATVRTVSIMVTDAEAVEEAIRGDALCAICISRRTGVAPISILSALALIGPRAKITDAVSRCAGCLQVKNTHRAA
jgi:hypothetical protein